MTNPIDVPETPAAAPGDDFRPADPAETPAAAEPRQQPPADDGDDRPEQPPTAP